MDDALARRARRAYEIGRLRAALGWMVWPIAVAALAGIAGTSTPAFAISIGVLLSIAVVLGRFRGGIAGRAIVAGMAAGSVAFVLAWIAVLACGDGCAPRGATTACIATGLAIGGLAGFSFRLPHNARAIHVLEALLVTAACGALGCAFAGLGAVLGLLGGVAASVPVVVWRLRQV
jgi:hypothetical protein